MYGFSFNTPHQLSMPDAPFFFVFLAGVADGGGGVPIGGGGRRGLAAAARPGGGRGGGSGTGSAAGPGVCEIDRPFVLIPHLRANGAVAGAVSWLTVRRRLSRGDIMAIRPPRCTQKACFPTVGLGFG